MFSLPVYNAPDFSTPVTQRAPDAIVALAPKDGVAPENYHATSIYPEYVKLHGRWVLAEESRMDCVMVVLEGDAIAIREFRNLKAGDRVVLGRSEHGEDGVYVHMDGFSHGNENHEQFAFRTSRSRETAYSRDYDRLYELLKYEREHGNILWVLGPACSFDSDARDAMADLIDRGYVQGLQAGNALATHDLEGGLFRTALGQDIYTQEVQHNGHYHHIDVINKVHSCGSIPAFIEKHGIHDGIMHACVKNNVPFVLTGSIRDDGPLPEVFADVYRGQDAMRQLVRRATTVICMATQLHTIAIGNMTPSFRVMGGTVRPVYLYTVDISEFSVNKLRDRGSLAVTSLIANAQDFLVHVSRGLGKMGG
jgi:lysine-ketoglutarate reductase/saccharopine dehydrogenase-like protein (TIGR00300 family)